MSPTSAPQTGARGTVLSLLIAIALAALASPGAAGASDGIYWPNAGSNTIEHAALDGSGGAALPLGLALPREPNGMAIDVAAGRVYWANYEGGSLSYASLAGGAGGNLTIQGTTVARPVGVAIDPSTRKLYWADSELDKISYANLDGSGAGDLATGAATLERPNGVALDLAAGRIYWANRDANKISYANLNGSGGGDLATGAASVSEPVGPAIDLTAGRIYWSNLGNDTISYASLGGSVEGGDLPTGAATVKRPAGVAIDHAAGRIYWANAEAPQISYASLNGSGGGDLSTPGASFDEASFPALLESPAGTEAPQITGAAIVGKPLYCSEGKWASDEVGAFLFRSAVTYSYSWLRNGEPVAGAIEAWYRPNKPGIYDCRVTAGNEAGSTAQTSAELNLERGYAYANGFAPVHGRQALVTLSCTGNDRCKGLVKLIGHIGYKRVVFREGRRQVIRRRSLFPIGKGRFSIYPGRTKVAHVKLKRKGAQLLRRRPGRRWHVRLLGRDVAHRGLMLKMQR